MLVPGIQAMLGVSRAGLVSTFTSIYLCYLNSEVYQHSGSPVVIVILVNSRSISALLFSSSSRAFTSGIVRSTSSFCASVHEYLALFKYAAMVTQALLTAQVSLEEL